MSVDPKDLRAGQRIDLITDDGVEVRNVLLHAAGAPTEHWLQAEVFETLFTIRHSGGEVEDDLTVTAIRSQPDPELYLDRHHFVWYGNDGKYGRPFSHPWSLLSLSDLRTKYGPLRRLTAGDPIGNDQ